MAVDTEISLLRIPEAAAELGVSRAKAYELAAAEVIPVVRLGGRALRVPKQALAEWIARNTVGGTERGATPARMTPREFGRVSDRTPIP